MSRLNQFVNKLKSSQVEAKPEPEPEPQAEVKPEPEPQAEVKPEPKVKVEVKSAYVARRPHAKTQKRNETFAEFITSDEAIELIKNVKNTQKLKTLVNAFMERYSERIPLVTAYSIYNQIRN